MLYLTSYRTSRQWSSGRHSTLDRESDVFRKDLDLPELHAHLRKRFLGDPSRVKDPASYERQSAIRRVFGLC